MKHRFKNHAALAIIVISCFTLSSCLEKKYEEHFDGYFGYIHVSSGQNKQGKKIVITGFTQSGIEQETIDIPREINGHPVYRIGFHSNVGGHTEFKVKCSEKLNKIYLHNNIETIELFEGTNVDMMVCSNFSRPSIGSFVSFKSIYYCKQLYEELGLDNPNNQTAGRLADVAFLYNYASESNETIHMIDNLNNENKINLPPEPVRDGYSFTGWYTEPECTNVWDFNDTPLIEKGNQLNLYAGWKIA